MISKLPGFELYSFESATRFNYDFDCVSWVQRFKLKEGTSQRSRHLPYIYMYM